MKIHPWVFWLATWVAVSHIYFPDKAIAVEITYGKSVPTFLLNGKSWVWQVKSFEGKKTLEVRTAGDLESSNENGKTRSLLVADISSCYFCSGDEDNCRADGIHIFQISRYPDPVIRVVCHVGAHSQKLMIFDPRKDKHQPVFQRTGAYWLTVSHNADSLDVDYDKSGFAAHCQDGRESAEGFCDIHERWP